MADLIDRLAGTTTERPKINLHRFVGAEQLYAVGVFTRAEIAAEFDMQGDEATQGVQLANAIDAASPALNKLIYIQRVNSVLMCVEDGGDRLYHNQDGTVNKAKIVADLLLG